MAAACLEHVDQPSQQQIQMNGDGTRTENREKKSTSVRGDWVGAAGELSRGSPHTESPLDNKFGMLQASKLPQVNLHMSRIKQTAPYQLGPIVQEAQHQDGHKTKKSSRCYSFAHL